MKISRVLLVEDNPEDAMMTRQALEPHDCSVDVVEDGETAIQRLTGSAEPPDLILLDLYLPKKNGLEVLDAIRREKALDTTPILVLTSSSATEQYLKQFNGRLNGCIHKPVNWDDFCRAAGVASGDAAVESPF